MHKNLNVNMSLNVQLIVVTFAVVCAPTFAVRFDISPQGHWNLAESFWFRSDYGNNGYINGASVNSSSETSIDDNIRFLFYKRNRLCVIKLNGATNNHFCEFDKDAKKTVIIIHGFKNGPHSTVPQSLKDAYIEAGLLYNIIVVDWRKLNSDDILEYDLVVFKNLPVVAYQVALFIQLLVADDWHQLERIHLVGHSLGAYISGLVGSILASKRKNLNNEKVGRISGLDSAGTCFAASRMGCFPCPVSTRARHLQRTDARIVDTYHSNEGSFGSARKDDGDFVFFINNGFLQPGCAKTTFLCLILDAYEPNTDVLGCSHEFAAKFWAWSVNPDMKYETCTCKDIQGDFGLFAGVTCLGSDCTNPSKMVPGEWLEAKNKGVNQLFNIRTDADALPIESYDFILF